MAKGNMTMWKPPGQAFHGVPMSKAAKKLTPQGQKEIDAELEQKAANAEEKPQHPAPRLNPQKTPLQGRESQLQAAQNRYKELAGAQRDQNKGKGMLLILGAIIAGGAYVLSQENKKGEKGDN